MPIYDPKRKVFVQPLTGLNLNYGFLTNVDPSISAVLGHQEVGTTIPPLTVFGANSPKPARATRRFINGIRSSFCDVSAVTSARSQGWSVGSARLRKGGESTFSIIVYINIEGIKYAWPMPLRLYDIIFAEVAGLGINISTVNDNDLVFGASSPKPPRAYKVLIGAEGADNLSTFVDPTVTLPVGWKFVGSKRDPLQSL